MRLTVAYIYNEGCVRSLIASLSEHRTQSTWSISAQSLGNKRMTRREFPGRSRGSSQVGCVEMISRFVEYVNSKSVQNMIKVFER